MAAFVSLFRGINVGGNHKVSMVDLKEMHEALGLENVVTYLQTGNVVFTSNDSSPIQLAERIERGFVQKFGFRVMVTVRTVEQFDKIVENNPFQEQSSTEAKWVVLLFLAASAAITAQEELRQAYAGPEEFLVSGQEMYLYYSQRIGRTKLSNALLEKKLQTTGTGRNWNTVLEIQKLLHR
jgi:uncharacterized protein (DUF1697 family)